MTLLIPNSLITMTINQTHSKLAPSRKATCVVYFITGVEGKTCFKITQVLFAVRLFDFEIEESKARSKVNEVGARNLRRVLRQEGRTRESYPIIDVEKDRPLRPETKFVASSTVFVFILRFYSLFCPPQRLRSRQRCDKWSPCR